MNHINPSRREFLRVASSLSTLGAVAGPVGINLAAIGAAAAQTAMPSDYKALVCIFLFGGNDSANMILPTDTDSWGRYEAARKQGTAPIALPPVGTPSSGARGASGYLGGVLPITPRTAQAFPPGTVGSGARSFALHPALVKTRGLFDSGRLAVLANVGMLIQPTTKAQYGSRKWPLPRSLFSHNDQASEWQAGSAEGARIGWAGQMGDLFASANGSPLFTAVSTSINAVLLAGRQIDQYQVSYNKTAQSAGAIHMLAANAGQSIFNSRGAQDVARAIVTAPAGSSLIQRDYAAVARRSLNAEAVLSAAFAGSPVAPPTQYTNPSTGETGSNPIATQLQSVAQFIAARNTLGTKRQIFFVSIYGFDTHSGQSSAQPTLMAQLDHALDYFYGTLKTGMGTDMTPNVTAFTMSDFGRTFTSNGDGSDHGWGGHHLVLGGAVKGGDIYNQFPTVGVDLKGKFDNPDGISSGVLVPTVSVDQYAATLGAWFGVGASELKLIFPNLANFGKANLGFV